MGPKLRGHRPVFAILFCALFLVVSMFAAPPAGAQQLDTGYVKSLLEKLESLEKRGLLGAREGREGRRIGRSPLDRLRERALREPFFSPFSTEDEPLQDEFTERRFSPIEGLFIQQFCEGEIGEAEEKALRLVTNFSRMERDYCRRAGEVLLQFGYEMFDVEVLPEVLVSGVIQDDYVLGIGDQLVITFRGQEARTIETWVDREGRVILRDMAPIVAAGHTFGEFRRDLEARTEASLFATEVFVSLGAVRLVSVTITGEVRQPGVRQLTGLSTVLDAIAVSDGIKKTGSLRRIQVHRGDRIFWVDLYEFLFGGGSGHSLALRDGDRIIVPTVGPTVAVGSQVKRPGIFELAEGKSSVTIAEALSYAGGGLRPKGNRFSQITFDDSGRQLVVERTDESAITTDGDIILVTYADDVQLGAVDLAGHVRVPGRRSLASAATLRALIGDHNSLKDDPYLLFAALETTDPVTRSRQLFPINLQSIIGGLQDYSLRDHDRLIVLSRQDMRYLASADVQEILARSPLSARLALSQASDSVERTSRRGASQEQPSRIGTVLRAAGATAVAITASPTASDGPTGLDEGEVSLLRFPCRGLEVLAGIVSGARAERFANAIRAQTTVVDSTQVIRAPCPQAFDQYPNLLPFVLEHVAAVNGEVRRPGLYPVLTGTPLSSVVAVAGGVTREVDLTRVEISRYIPDPETGTAETSRGLANIVAQGIETISVSPGDVIRFNPVFTDRDTGPVLISGEFLRPGYYEIRRGERLSQVIQRAGGVSAQAYPYGAVFTRERVKRQQQIGFQRAARELNAALAVAVVTKGVDPGAIVALSDLSQELGSIEAVGRVVIEADPTVLQVRPELDTVLEPGDRLFMPKRPNSVLVIGDVLNPGALQFISGTKADRYIRQAGGFQKAADEDRVFVVYPNGEAQPLSVSVWNYSPAQIPPGSTIVVPKEPAPLDLLTFTKDIAALLSQLAITAASLAVISSN